MVFAPLRLLRRSAADIVREDRDWEMAAFDVAPSPRAVVDLVGRRYLSANKNLFLFKNKNM